MLNKAVLLSRIKNSPWALKENLEDHKGQITLYALLLSMMLLCYALFIVLKCGRNHLEIKERLQTYQCLHYQDYQTSLYIKHMGRLNRAIWLTHKTIFLPQGRALHKALVSSQDILHFSYLKNLLHNPYCRLDQASTYVTNLPYRTRLIFFLEHQLDGTIKLNKKEWEIWLWALSKKKPLFILRGTYKVENDFSSSSQFLASEETPS